MEYSKHRIKKTINASIHITYRRQKQERTKKMNRNVIESEGEKTPYKLIYSHGTFQFK